MMSTFIIVNIITLLQHVRDSLEDKSILVHSKKRQNVLGIYLKEELTDLF